MRTFNQAIAVLILSFLFISSPVSALQEETQQLGELEASLQETTGKHRLQILADLVEASYKDRKDAALAYGAEALDLVAEIPDAAIEARVRVRMSMIYSSRGDTETGLEFAKTSRSLAAAVGDEQAMAVANYHIALAYWYRSEIETAIETAKRARDIQLRLELQDELADTYTLLGAIHRTRSALDEALVYHLAALDISEKSGNKETAIARSLNNIGLIYWDLDQHDRAKRYLQRALEVYREIDSPTRLAAVLSNLGLINIELKEPEKALVLLEESLEYHNEIDQPRSKARILSNMGFANETLGRFDEALALNDQALKIREDLEDDHGLARTLGCIGGIHIKAGRPERAIEHLTRAVDHAEKCDARLEQIEIHRMLSRAYKETGQHEDALTSVNHLIEISEEVDETEMAVRVAEIEANAKLEEQNDRVESLENERLAQELELSRQRTRQMILISVFVSLMAVAISFIFIGQKRTLAARQQSNDELEQTISKLRQSEQRYRSVFDDATIPKFLLDLREWKLLAANQQALKLCGSGEEELKNCHVRAISKRWIADALEKTGSSDTVWMEEWKDENLSTRFAEFRAIPCTIDDRKCSLVSVHDVTERHRLEEEHIRNEKLESIGLLAGGIAHDFNNALSAVLGLVSIARHKSGENDELERLLIRAESAASHAQNLTGQLLSFSKGGEARKEFCDVEQLLHESVNFGLAGSSLKVDFDIADNISAIEVDRGQFNQVISNLVINADHAMEDGGRLIVRARNVLWRNEMISDDALLPHVRIDIRDFGPGIPEEIRDKILNPYFTTKEHGTGLGLTTTLAIMLRHNGWLEFDTETGKGTVFSLYFPAGSDSEATNAGSQEHAGLTRGSGSILVMDDDPDVLATYRLGLSELGYSVETASGGEEVLERWSEASENGDPFDLVILDLTIQGGMGGVETMTRLREEAPEAVGIVASGYTQAPVISEYHEAGFSGSLKKPFTLQQIGQLLSKLLPEGSHADGRSKADPNLPR